MDQLKENFFQVRDLTKVYKMGELEVHALRGVNIELADAYVGNWSNFYGLPEGSIGEITIHVAGKRGVEKGAKLVELQQTDKTTRYKLRR